MADFILIVLIALIVGAAIIYIRKEKKRGVKCIGCPSAGECARKQKESSGCGCGCHTE